MRSRPNRVMRPRQPETHVFRSAFIALRGEMGWTQEVLAMKLGISKRTLSNWENGYWLPPPNQRLHVVLAVRDAPPEYVLHIANALGVSVDPAVAPFLKPFRDALEDDGAAPEVPPPPPVPPPPRVPPTPEAVRAAVDAVVREAADAMNVAANDLREALDRTLASCAGLGATLEETRGALVVKAKRPKAG